eukprot:TRINITY_DN12956_c0_g1_i1.p1 TRINITY_DN12956_c0_g1~~TRINITY_DN12956_c0_g1_i1.p1  ORF type:complete len:265 (+),score=36.72 TRINITY_DN12956_c0_g1_i1:212-1006(+)
MITATLEAKPSESVCDPGMRPWHGNQYICSETATEQHRCCVHLGTQPGVAFRLVLNGQALPVFQTVQETGILGLVDRLTLWNASAIGRGQDLLVEIVATKRPKTPVTLFIGVLSAPQNALMRAVHRKGWMGSLASDVQVKFFLGIASSAQRRALVEAEAAKFGDIVILSEPEGYRAIAKKSLAILEHGSGEAAYTLKMDDDSFVDVPGLLKTLNLHSLHKHLYMGHVSVFAAPPVSYTHLRAHETVLDLVCRLLLEKKKKYRIR